MAHRNDLEKAAWRIDNLRKIARRYVQENRKLGHEELNELYNGGVDLGTIVCWLHDVRVKEYQDERCGIVR